MVVKYFLGSDFDVLNSTKNVNPVINQGNFARNFYLSNCQLFGNMYYI